MSATFTEIITLTKLNCGSCSIVFAIPEERLKKLKDTGELFYCPNGCRIGYTQSTVNRLEDELAAKRTELTAAKCEAMRERQLREQTESEKRELERKARRVNKGVCPCCNRSFSNLKRHMETKHAGQHAERGSK